MTHYGSLGTQTVSEDIRDVRGTNGSRGRRHKPTNLREVDDVIFGHETMEIHYLVVDSGGWLEAIICLLPADSVSAAEDDEADLTACVTKQQIANSPQYDKKTPQSADELEEIRAGSLKGIGTNSL